MKFRFLCICILLFVFNMFFMADASSLQVSAKSAVLICADSGQIIYEHNAFERLSMASTTKIMTALLAIENLALDAKITVGDEVLHVDGTSLGLQPGDTISVYDLLVGLMLSSGNDAANVTAVAVSGSLQDFVTLMNQKAEEIGLCHTSFVTPSGLDGEEHYSTAYDMALLTRKALQNDVFVDIVSQYTATIQISNRKVWLKNHNRLLNSYDGMIGVKTGFTKKSGRCLVTAAERNESCLIAVTLSAPDDWSDHSALLDYGFTVIEDFEVFDEQPVYYADVVGGKADRVKCIPAISPSYNAVQRLSDIQTEVFLYPFVYAPVKQGDIIGELVCVYDGTELDRVPLCAMQDVDLNYIGTNKENKWQQLLQKVYGWLSYG